MALWAVRHAPVEAKGLCYGQTDLRAAVAADVAAEAIRAALEARGAIRFAEVWCSPWSRTREPARLLAARSGAAVRIAPELSELHFGDWEARPWNDLSRDDERLHAWMEHWQSARPPGGETWPELQARVAAWVAAREPLDADRLLVTHAGPIRALRVLLEGIAASEAFAQPVEHLVPLRFEP